MIYVDKLLQETKYLELLGRLELLEQDRIFCRHGLEHLLDTARIAWIGWLEQQLEYQPGQDVACREPGEGGYPVKAPGYSQSGYSVKEQIYLAALLHDLGRVWEYEKGIPHEEAGVEIARELLEEIQYPMEFQEKVLCAIGAHRDKGCKSGNNIYGEFLKWADKKSRNCFQCKAQKACKWSEEKRNQSVTY